MSGPARRGIAVVNSMAPDRHDISVTVRVLPQQKAPPVEVTELFLSSILRFLAGHHRGVLLFRLGKR